MNEFTEQGQALKWISDQHHATVERLIDLANTNSGSYNVDGLQQVAKAFTELFEPLADSHRAISLAPFTEVDENGELSPIAVGQALQFQRRAEAPLKILFVGHLDTVFPSDSHFQSCRYLDDNTINGPGVADMKGGILVMWLAIQALERSPMRNKIGWEVLLNPDEEISSRASAPLLKQSAETAQVGLIFEPSLPDGTLAGARKGTGNFSLVVTGRSAHAGREFERGRNAIAALAQAMTAVHLLNGQRDGVTLNLGRIHGGGPLNAVPDNAVCHFNVRTTTPDDEQWVLQNLDTILLQINTLDGIRIERHGEFTRPPKIITPSNQLLFDLLQGCGQELGVNIDFKPTGGCCDGNNLAAAGLPNIDTLGVRGGKIHTEQEFIALDSICERAQLTYLLISKIIANSEAFSQSAK